jgi:hypothetical protein
MSRSSTAIDPELASAFPMRSWRARLMALRSRAVPDDDPRVVECHAALAFWRLDRAIDAESAALRPRDAMLLADRLWPGERATSKTARAAVPQ